MSAVVWHGTGDVRLETVSLPSPRAAEVRVKIASAGICGSDLSMINGAWKGVSAGRILGHEASGVVDAVGHEVDDLELGSRVAVKVTSSCGRCTHCRNGYPSLCQYRIRHGGCCADAVVVPRSAVYELPVQLELEVGALSEPLACAVEAWGQSGAQLGDDVAIVGGGTIGLLLARLASVGGARAVLVITRSPAKAQLATVMGATLTVESRPDIASTVSEATTVLGGAPDVVFEAAGVAASNELSLALAGRGGRLVLVGCGHTDDSVTMKPHDIVERALTVRGSFGESFAMQRAVRLLPMLQLEPLITDRFPLHEYDRALVRASSGGVKVMLTPTSPA